MGSSGLGERRKCRASVQIEPWRIPASIPLGGNSLRTSRVHNILGASHVHCQCLRVVISTIQGTWNMEKGSSRMLFTRPRQFVQRPAASPASGRCKLFRARGSVFKKGRNSRAASTCGKQYFRPATLAAGASVRIADCVSIGAICFTAWLRFSGGAVSIRQGFAPCCGMRCRRSLRGPLMRATTNRLRRRGCSRTQSTSVERRLGPCAKANPRVEPG